VDHVLRKEVDLECKTPSHPDIIPPGESLDIHQLLEKGDEAKLDPDVESAKIPDLTRFAYTPQPRVIETLEKLENPLYLRAQIARDDAEIKALVKEASAKNSTPADESARSAAKATKATSPKDGIRRRRGLIKAKTNKYGVTDGYDPTLNRQTKNAYAKIERMSNSQYASGPTSPPPFYASSAWSSDQSPSASHYPELWGPEVDARFRALECGKSPYENAVGYS